MTTPDTPPKSRRPLILVAAMLLSLVGCGLAVMNGWITSETLQTAVDPTRPSGVAVFIGLAVLLELLWLPRMWVLMGAGILFGIRDGILLSIVSDTLSALICYALARGAGREWAAAMISKRPRAHQVINLLARRRGGVSVAVLRSMPIAHYTMVSYLAGLTGVAFTPFIIGNTIGLVPGALLYVIVGASMLDPTSPVFIGAMIVLLIAFVLTTILGRRVLKSGASPPIKE